MFKAILSYLIHTYLCVGKVRGGSARFFNPESAKKWSSMGGGEGEGGSDRLWKIEKRLFQLWKIRLFSFFNEGLLPYESLKHIAQKEKSQ